MKRLIRLVCLCALMAPAATSQSIPVDVRDDLHSGTGYHLLWDSVQDELILLRNVSMPEEPAVRLVRSSGRSLPISPLRDFPEARQVAIWGAAATPRGGVVFSSTISYGEPGTHTQPFPVKSLVLTYDETGNLIRLWDVRPYHHFLIAADAAGNVYAVGLQDSSDRAYPMLIKYSPEGKVLKEFFPANTYSIGDNVIANPTPRGENRLFIYSDKLYLWLAEPSELWSFSLGGRFLNRTSLVPALQTLADPSVVRTIEVVRLGLEADHIILQVRLWPKKPEDKVKYEMVMLAGDGSQVRVMGAASVSPDPGRFLGVSGGGRLVFLEQTARGTGIVRQH